MTYLYRLQNKHPGLSFDCIDLDLIHSRTTSTSKIDIFYALTKYSTLTRNDFIFQLIDSMMDG